MRFTLRQLEIFVAVARHGSVSAAAKELALTQSASSTALAELERQGGRQLFDRIGKSLQLNEIGQALLPRAAELLDRAAEIGGLLRGDGAIGTLRVGATLTIGNYLATLIAADFLRQHPQARLFLEVKNTALLLPALLGHAVDLGLLEGDFRHPDLEITPWIEDELAVFCAPTHPWAGCTLDAAELAAAPWIQRETGSATRATFERAFHKFLPHLNIRLELEHTEAIKRAVESGIGIGCISRLALRDAFRRGSLVEIHTQGLDLRRTFSFAWHRGKYHGAAMRTFLALCRETTRGATRSDEIVLPSIP